MQTQHNSNFYHSRHEGHLFGNCGFCVSSWVQRVTTANVGLEELFPVACVSVKQWIQKMTFSFWKKPHIKKDVFFCWNTPKKHCNSTRTTEITCKHYIFIQFKHNVALYTCLAFGFPWLFVQWVNPYSSIPQTNPEINSKIRHESFLCLPLHALQLTSNQEGVYSPLLCSFIGYHAPHKPVDLFSQWCFA